jgi:hypothetical protein
MSRASSELGWASMMVPALRPTHQSGVTVAKPYGTGIALIHPRNFTSHMINGIALIVKHYIILVKAMDLVLNSLAESGRLLRQVGRLAMAETGLFVES